LPTHFLAGSHSNSHRTTSFSPPSEGGLAIQAAVICIFSVPPKIQITSRPRTQYGVARKAPLLCASPFGQSEAQACGSKVFLYYI